MLDDGAVVVGAVLIGLEGDFFAEAVPLVELLRGPIWMMSSAWESVLAKIEGLGDLELAIGVGAVGEDLGPAFLWNVRVIGADLGMVDDLERSSFLAE